MSVIDSFTKKVSNTYKAAAKKSSEILEITKINFNIEVEETKINELFAQIGKTIYTNKLFGDNLPEDLQQFFAEIKSKEKLIESYKSTILDLKGTKICPSCSEEVELDMSFCPSCGTEQEKIKPIELEKTCQMCSCVNKVEFLFCSQCGNKF